MAIKGFEWLDGDKQAHVIGGIMIYGICRGFLQFDSKTSMLCVTAASLLKEIFDHYRADIKLFNYRFRPGKFDKWDIIATMMGGAVAATSDGIIINIIKLFV